MILISIMNSILITGITWLSSLKAFTHWNKIFQQITLNYNRKKPLRCIIWCRNAGKDSKCLHNRNYLFENTYNNSVNFKTILIILKTKHSLTISKRLKSIRRISLSFKTKVLYYMLTNMLLYSISLSSFLYNEKSFAFSTFSTNFLLLKIPE